MKCPTCKSVKNIVKDSRHIDIINGKRRRRECSHCGHRFTTTEIISSPNQVKILLGHKPKKKPEPKKKIRRIPKQSIVKISTDKCLSGYECKGCKRIYDTLIKPDNCVSCSSVEFIKLYY